jgi:NAD/NADP transhydrogenase alpha subunit
MEGRVALVPAAADLMRRGHEVFIQAGAGEKSGFSDETYSKVSVKPVPDAGVLMPQRQGAAHGHRETVKTISATVLPYVQRLAAGKEWREFEPLKKGMNVDGGKLVHPALQAVV